MKKKCFVGLMLILLAASLTPAESPSPAERKGGYVILDTYIAVFREMAAKGSNGILESNLNNIMTQVVKAKTQGEIDDIFYSRFARLMAVTKLVIVPDAGHILKPIIERETRRFVEDILGEEAAAAPELGIGTLAESITQELLNLQIYLDTKDQRKKMMEEFYKKFDDTAKK